MTVDYKMPLTSDGEGLCLLREVELVYVGKSVRTERVRSSRDADTFFRKVIKLGPREVFVALFLDAKSKPTGWYRFSGGLTHVALVPRDVFAPAIRASAASLIVCHNHPSGDPTPSAEDSAITERLRKGGELLDIRLLDHVIIADRGYFSFLDSGMLAPS